MEKDKSVAQMDPMRGGIAATSLHTTVASLDASSHSFLFVSVTSCRCWYDPSTASDTGILSFPNSRRIFILKFGKCFAIQGINVGLEDASKLLPSVFAINGKTLSVSSAGNITTKVDAIFIKTRTTGEM
jgi:hypothetical protein